MRQLTCVGPSKVCNLYDVEVMRCTNEGSDYDTENIQWACRADLPEEFKLGSTEIACEGYASRDDPYVLKGSCAVEYRMLLTEKGEERFGSGSQSDQEQMSTLATVIFFAIFAAVLFIIFTRLVDQCRRNGPRSRNTGQRPPWFGGGGGGGDNGNDDPPPPYDSHHFSPPRKPGASSTRNYGTAGSSRTAAQQQGGWRPGPWTAGLAGAGLGYALGRNQNRTQTQPRDTNPRPGGGLFGGGTAGPSNSRSSPPIFSSSRHTSTGFGGTSRR